jgi:hypothetical protein
VLRIYGVHVSEEGGRYLYALLLARGGPDAVAAADAISLGVKRGLSHSVPLTVRQREAILSVMAVPPPGLEELHRKLIVDQADRVRFAA